MGGPPSTTRQTQVQEPSAFIKPHLSYLYGGAKGVAQRPFEGFGGDRIGGFSPDEMTAQGGIRRLYDMGDRPELSWGKRRTQESTGLSGEAADVARGIGKFDREAFDQYSSPYFEGVLDIQKRNARQEAMRMQSQIGARQAMQGGYGSMRHGILEAELMKGTQQNLSDIEAKGRQQAWENALSAYQSDQQTAIQGGELMLSSGDALMEAASQAMDFSDVQQSQAMDRIAALESSGMNQREMEQAIKDMAYSDFVERRDWQQNQLSWLASILGGFPVPMNATQRTTQPGPSIGAQVGGLAAIGAGAYGMSQNE